MTSGAGSMGDFFSSDDVAWWYRSGTGTSGPVSLTELRRLAKTGLSPATLVWKKDFGDHWTRLDAAVASADAQGAPPSVDYGTWNTSFAKSAANPRKSQWSWLGLLGPIGYLCLGMWKRALIIFSALMACELFFAVGDAASRRDTGSHGFLIYMMLFYCVWSLKGHYYRFRVFGEPVWPRLRALSNGYVCGGLALFLVSATWIAHAVNPVEIMIADVSGVWQSNGAPVVVDVAGASKSITYGGAVYHVDVKSADDDDGVIVFEDFSNPATLITLQKHWSDDHASYSLDLLVNDQLVGNLTFLRPA